MTDIVHQCLRWTEYGYHQEAADEIVRLRECLKERDGLCKRLEDEIERLREKLAISDQAVGVSEWRRQECLRLGEALEYADRQIKSLQQIKAWDVKTIERLYTALMEIASWTLPTGRDAQDVAREALKGDSNG